MLEYKPHCSEVLERLASLYAGQAGERIFATLRVPSPALAAFAEAHPAGPCECPDPIERADFWDRLCRERAAVEDDSLPAAYLSELDQGLYGGLLGGQVRFLCGAVPGWISSMVPPLLTDWSQLDALRLDESHPWWQRYLEQLQLFAARAAGRWGVSHFIIVDSLNFVIELLGATQTYLSLDEHPEQVRRAIDLGYELNVRVHEAFFEAVGLFQGGTFSNYGQWLPGRIVSESLDPFHLTSVACFEQWGREPAERILGHFDGGVVHIHANGRHLLKAAATLRGLRLLELMDDTGLPPTFDVLEKLKSVTGQVPLSCPASFAPFVERLERHTLPGGVLYHVAGVPDADTANRLMEKVRAYKNDQ
ncbi:MAG: hypothetical protein ABSF26_12100 [Thermoguttaceae bacterium]|jgi:hypothetical protein